MKKFSLLLILAVTMVVLFSPASSAGAVPSLWPECGDHAVISPGEYSNANLTIVYGRFGSDYTVEFNSYNGWKIYTFQIIYNNGSASANFPDGTTSDTAYLGRDTADIISIDVELYKDCLSSSTCKPTEYYVYTLLGNYPCSLVTGDHPIPDRFLNPNYTGPLCQLPEQEHQWNGEWIVNEVKICNGYQVGGKYYDTSRTKLP